MSDNNNGFNPKVCELMMQQLELGLNAKIDSLAVQIQQLTKDLASYRQEGKERNKAIWAKAGVLAGVFGVVMASLWKLYDIITNK